jgi:hypothetical protein
MAPVLGVERREPLPDQHVFVRPGIVGAPGDTAVLRVQRRDPAADAELAAAVADHDLAQGHERRHRDGLADIDVAEPGPPELLAAPGIERDRLAVERVVEHPALGIGNTTVHGIAAGDPLGGRERLRLVLPLERRAGLREVERIQNVRIARDHEHRALGHDRRRLLPAQHPQREGPGDAKPLDVPNIDLIEPAVPEPREIPPRDRPVAILLRRARPHAARDPQTQAQRGKPPRNGPLAQTTLRGARRTSKRAEESNVAPGCRVPTAGGRGRAEVRAHERNCAT